MNNNSKAILVFCSNVCVGKDVFPLRPSEWKKLASLLLQNNLEPNDLLSFSKDDFTHILGLDESFANRLTRLTDRSASLFFELEKYKQMGISIITRADIEYPINIKNKLGASCPPLFFFAGNINLLKKNSIGFEGSRFLNEDDEIFEQAIVKKVVEAGYTIVSGGAKGTDILAEENSLSSGGFAIEFSAYSMMDRLRSNKMIKAMQDGRFLLMSTVNPESRFNVGNAMARNRFICAQAKAIIAIKSINKGGTWSGVIDNLKHNFCPVFCWNNKAYPDNLELIEQGAIPMDETWSPEMIQTAKTQLAAPSRYKRSQLSLAI